MASRESRLDNEDIPSNPENKREAEEIGAYFIDKNSPTTLKDFDYFLLKHLGFGDFIFLKPKNKKTKKTPIPIHGSTVEIAKASNLKEFEKTLQKIPLESIRFHANRNDFSNWLIARCEFKLARKLRPAKVSDFTTLDELRKYLINVFNESRREKQVDVMTDFSQQKFEFESSYTRIGGDSLGGKGRGIAFIRSILAKYNLEKEFIVDSFPISVCKLARMSRNKIYHSKKYLGYCAAKKEYYFGMKLHLICDVNGGPVQTFLTPASENDIKAFKKFNLKLPFNATIYGDCVGPNTYETNWCKIKGL